MSTAGDIGGILAVTTSSVSSVGGVMNLVDPVTTSSVGGPEPVEWAATYDYSPFGKLLVSTGPAAGSNPIHFSTKWGDETGLYYYGMRYYSPGIWRWIRWDPLQNTVWFRDRLKGASEDEMERLLEAALGPPYTFVSNGCIRATDSLGEVSWITAGLIAAAAATGAGTLCAAQRLRQAPSEA